MDMYMPWYSLNSNVALLENRGLGNDIEGRAADWLRHLPASKPATIPRRTATGPGPVTIFRISPIMIQPLHLFRQVMFIFPLYSYFVSFPHILFTSAVVIFIV